MNIMEASDLDYLQHSINSAINNLRDEMRSQNLPPFKLYAAEPHPVDNPTYLLTARMYESRKLLLAAIGQLKSLVQVPFEQVVEQTCAVYDSAALDIFVRCGLADILLRRDSEYGCNAAELAATVGIDHVKLMSILRLLCAQGWLVELKESYYSLSRAGLELCEGKNGYKWALTPGKLKIASALYSQITHEKWKYSTSPEETAFQLSHDTSLSLFQYLECNPLELKQWAASVKTMGDISEASILQDYPWSKLTSTLIVDCGGGQGHLSASLARLLPQTRFVVQDLPEVIPITQLSLQAEVPDIMSQGQITVESHNFFTRQPHIEHGTTYLFRHILHDWPDNDCIKILSSSQPQHSEFKIIIIEFIVESAAFIGTNATPSTSPCGQLDALKGTYVYKPIEPPACIPKSFGISHKMSLALGIHMMGLFNARERSLAEWRQIIEASGLFISSVYPTRGRLSLIECCPNRSRMNLHSCI